ncbi:MULTISPECIES: hypothetical protein [Pseudanabaena]|uniref:Uncharacterized protein n=2 Tax=Pseudanabaena TaxID=1152 RepID=L8MWT0_9CYAN|nr:MULTISPECIES: hypothetical protein [Pseudanabaena]ELS32447.1 hypothetical protein Pse7429DRAFT_2642 [Pseudanabaena biceps PCC 7429]MDG3495304.1 hypothetical protein [Pseudanabaena catenata USMAC16]
MMYFLLIRKISPYTAPDILLGAFTSEQATQDARKSYLDRYRPTDKKTTTNGWLAQIFPWLRCQPETDPNGDPWHKQAYKSDGLTEDDLIIQTFDMEGDPTFNEISVVSCYYDTMGQIFREIDSIHPNRLVAEQRMKEIETIAENAPATDHMPPNQFSTQTIRINEIHSDAPEQQPIR